MNLKKLAIIGIGEDGTEGLGVNAQKLISDAEIVFGGVRHLELAKSLIRGEMMLWESPLEPSVQKIIALHQEQKKQIVILASGDPFCYGIGVTLSRYLSPEEMFIIPAPSCFSLAAARLAWSLSEITTIGLNARAKEKIIPHLQPNAKILALSTDEATPHIIAELLNKRGFSEAKITVLEHLGGEKERIITFHTPNSTLQTPAFARLNMLAIEIPETAASKTKSLPLSPGLADELFEHDGQLTKREVRAITLSSLAPRKGELLWDIGLGAGSVAVEWLLRDPANRAIGFEKNPERAARAARNAAALGVPHLQIIEGNAPEILEGIEAPDAIFIGGGAGNPEFIEKAWNVLKPYGRLVVNCVTLESEISIINAYKKYGGSIVRIGIERDEKVGTMTGMRPAMSVLQWSITKYE